MVFAISKINKHIRKHKPQLSPYMGIFQMWENTLFQLNTVFLNPNLFPLPKSQFNFNFEKLVLSYFFSVVHAIQN